MITLSNSTTHRNRIERGEPVGPPAGPENKGQRAQRPEGGRKRGQRQKETAGREGWSGRVPRGDAAHTEQEPAEKHGM